MRYSDNRCCFMSRALRTSAADSLLAVTSVHIQVVFFTNDILPCDISNFPAAEMAVDLFTKQSRYLPGWIQDSLAILVDRSTKGTKLRVKKKQDTVYVGSGRVYTGWSDVTESVFTIRSPFCGYNSACCVELKGEDLWSYSHKTESVVYENVSTIISLPIKRI